MRQEDKSMLPGCAMTDWFKRNEHRVYPLGFCSAALIIIALVEWSR